MCSKLKLWLCCSWFLSCKLALCVLAPTRLHQQVTTAEEGGYAHPEKRLYLQGCFFPGQRRSVVFRWCVYAGSRKFPAINMSVCGAKTWCPVSFPFKNKMYCVEQTLQCGCQVLPPGEGMMLTMLEEFSCLWRALVGWTSTSQVSLAVEVRLSTCSCVHWLQWGSQQKAAVVDMF